MTGQSRPCAPEQKVNEWEEQKVESVGHGVMLSWSEMGKTWIQKKFEGKRKEVEGISPCRGWPG